MDGLILSLRFTNMKLDVKTGESNLIDQMTDFINTKILKNEDSISVSDVERCHPVNRLKSDGRCQILIKFHNYHTKRKVFSSNANLRGNPDHIFVSEDLTRTNYSIIKALQALKKSGKIFSYLSHNGNVFAKKHENNNPVRLYQLKDITSQLDISSP